MEKRTNLLIAASLVALGISLPANSADRLPVLEGETKTISENTVFTGQTGAWGGAIDNEGTVIVKNGVSFTGNTATQHGGAISNYLNASLDVTGASFLNNKAKNYGGAILNLNKIDIKDSSFTTNSASTGGAIFDQSEVLKVSGSTFTGNTATYDGGAAYVTQSLDISGAKFENNTAGLDGGAIFNNTATGLESVISNSTFMGNKAGGIGGAIWHNDGVLTVKDSIFTGNTATEQAGAIVTTTPTSVLNVLDSTFTENKGGAGGAVSLFAGLNKLSNVTFTKNEATDGRGGAVFLGATSKTVMDNVTFDGNTATEDGGALGTREIELGNNKDASLSITNSTFKNNEAGKNGGAIINTFHNVTVGNTTFENNSSTGKGGAVYNDTKDQSGEVASISFSNGTSFTGNHSTDDGGAMYNEGSFNLDGVTFKDNYSAADGGAIASRAEGTVSTITNTVFEGNYTTGAGADGGAISLQRGQIDISGSQFNNNESSYGGAIYTYIVHGNPATTTLNITDSSFTGNNAVQGASAGASGGALAIFATGNITNTSFTNNSATSSAADGGGAVYLGAESVTVFDGATFTGNSTNQYGGAIKTRGEAANNTAAKLEIKNSTFESNTAGVDGGAISNNFSNATVADTSFSGNTATGNGGAIYNAGVDASGTLSKVVITGDSNFSGNSAANGGAIFNNGVADVTGGTFANNNASNAGGALYNAGTGTATIANALFEGNQSKYGGAINNAGLSADALGTLNVSNSVFSQNTSSNGGAIRNQGVAEISGSDFSGNESSNGGAVWNGANGQLAVNDVSFSGNKATGGLGQGGAITSNGKMTLTNAAFDGNSADSNGGAIYTQDTEGKGGTTLTDTSFTNNSAAGKGGAVYAQSDVTINATNKDVVFSGNTAADGGDIYMQTAGSTLTLTAAADKAITSTGGISGDSAGTFNMNVNGGGAFNLDNYISNAAVNVTDASTFVYGSNASLNNSTLTMNDGTTLDTANNRADNFAPNVLTLNGDVNLTPDVDLTNGSAGDNFSNATVNGNVTITNVNIVGGSASANTGSVNIVDALGLNPNNVTISSELLTQTQTVLTPIRYLQGTVSQNGMLSFAPTGGSYKDFNPAVMASPIAAQLGGYLTQLNSYDQAFRNMDMYMLMTKSQREALKMRNQYAAADSNLVFDPINTPDTNKSAWFRPYATFENVPLKNGPKVSNVAYGSFFGGDSDLYDLGNGWDGMWGAYVGYNGSHQSYDGIGIYQNGGTLGAVGMAYKGNFFTGLTVNAGANAGEASTMYGNDNFSMLMAGIASKTGYNVELADGKFIIQPSFLASYSFVNTFDYTNAAGVSINSDPLHAIQIEPGVKFIGNLKNGWQPYLGVSMVWNIMDKTEFMANNVSLPELSIKPFVKYGVGVRKSWGDRFTGFFQTYFTNGGRNGVGLQLGFKWAIGKASSAKTSTKTPDLAKTQIKLSKVK